MRITILRSGVAALSLLLSTNAFAHDAAVEQSAAPAIATEYAKFTPNPTSQVKIDYAFPAAIKFRAEPATYQPIWLSL